MIEDKKLKSITFDLDTKALQEHYTKGDWHNAYSDISNFLGKYDFIHMQGSVYDSITKFSDDELGILIQTMAKELNWLPQCVKSIRGYDQPVMIDYTQQLKDRFTQDLSLENKQNLAIKRMKQKINEIDKSGKLKEMRPKKKDRDIDR
ncbi:Virulence-associated protein 2 [Helicobacter typhlonius]|uniref:Virulence-associated protein 2 n=1 Tax=Helicobacter typhlonius TaxID=76936 RepID=A0A0S4PW80_9HELI|nr:VapD [Helicobacter typhlonius]CUU40591.1 Virulence-associated protein 2 [Helicobacter typhlonius]